MTIYTSFIYHCPKLGLLNGWCSFCSCVHAWMFSCVWLFATPWHVAHQAPPSVEFASKNTGVGCYFLLQGIFLTQGLKSFACLLHWQVDSLPLAAPGKCQSRFHARYWMLGAGALGRPRGMVWGGSREEGSGWGTHVYLWRIHFDIWQN